MYSSYILTAAAVTLVIVLQFPTSNANQVCRDGAVYIGGQCLRFSTEKADSWQDAKQACSSINSQLASLKNPQAVLDYTEKHYDGVEFWVGGSDIILEGSWTWVSGEPITGLPWSGPACSFGQQPDNLGGHQDCLVVNWRCGGFDDQKCDGNPHRYICEEGVSWNENGVCPPGGGCPGINGLFQWNNGNCFHFSSDASKDQTASWSKAREHCKQIGSSIGRIVDLAELGNPNNLRSDDWLMETITAKGKTCYLGATDPDRNGNWFWVNSGRRLSMEFPLFGPTEPNHLGKGVENCLITWKFGNRNPPRQYIGDFPCSAEQYYVCQIFN